MKKASENPTRQTEIRSLTGLRGIAAAAVLVFHLTGNGHALGGLAGRVISHGYLAVDLFFVLSGFVMALTYGASFATGFKAGDYTMFLAKRLARVYPLFLAATVACATLSVADPSLEGALTVRTLLANLLMIQTWGLSYSLDYPGWSISTEFAAYLMFPVLVTATLRGPLRRACVAAVGAALLLLVLAGLSSADLHEVGSRLGPLDIWSAETPAPLLRCLSGFTLGLCAWRSFACPSVRRLASHGITALLLGVAVCVMLILPGSDLILVFLSVGLIVALAGSALSLPARFLSWPPVYWLGTVSYSLYLIHYPIRWAFERPLRAELEALHTPGAGSMTILSLAALSIALSAATHAWVELPGRALAGFLVRRRHAIAARPAPERS